MPTSRLEAFSDGVMAVIITIMVLELHVPAGDSLAALVHEVGSGLLTYLLSFAYVGIYWNNHHHLFHLAERATGTVLWANLHLLFWLSLLPFATAWMDGTGFARVPVIAYGVVLFAAGIAYVVLQSLLIRSGGESSALRAAVGRDAKGKASAGCYAAGILVALIVVPAWPGAIWITMGCYVVPALQWFLPDRRIEHYLTTHNEHAPNEPAPHDGRALEG